MLFRSSTLDDAYFLVQDLELIPRPQGGRRFDNRMLPHNNFDGPQGRYLQGTQNRPYPNNRPLQIEENLQGRYQQGPQTRPNPNNSPCAQKTKGRVWLERHLGQILESSALSVKDLVIWLPNVLIRLC